MHRHARGLLDTSTLLLLPRIRDSGSLPAEPAISTITLAELSVGPLVAGSEGERAARQAHLQQAEADFDPLPFDAAAARAFGRVVASLRRSGRKPAARAYDAVPRWRMHFRSTPATPTISQALRSLKSFQCLSAEKLTGISYPVGRHSSQEVCPWFTLPGGGPSLANPYNALALVRVHCVTLTIGPEE
jgi:tRNA(fMet)-specific endonuclease VapC